MSLTSIRICGVYVTYTYIPRICHLYLYSMYTSLILIFCVYMTYTLHIRHLLKTDTQADRELHMFMTL